MKHRFPLFIVLLMLVAAGVVFAQYQKNLQGEVIDVNPPPPPSTPPSCVKDFALVSAVVNGPFIGTGNPDNVCKADLISKVLNINPLDPTRPLDPGKVSVCAQYGTKHKNDCMSPCVYDRKEEFVINPFGYRYYGYLCSADKGTCKVTQKCILPSSTTTPTTATPPSGTPPPPPPPSPSPVPTPTPTPTPNPTTPPDDGCPDPKSLKPIFKQATGFNTREATADEKEGVRTLAEGLADIECTNTTMVPPAECTAGCKSESLSRRYVPDSDYSAPNPPKCDNGIPVTCDTRGNCVETRVCVPM